MGMEKEAKQTNSKENEQTNSKKPKCKKIAFLGELNIGTKLYSPEIMDGVAVIINGQEKLDSIIINGGLAARVPSIYSKRKRQYFELLDDDIEIKYGKGVAEKVKNLHDGFLFKRIGPKIGKADMGALLQESKEKRVGVDYKEDLIEIVQYEIAKLKTNPATKFYYVWSEEDYFNVDDILEGLIKEESQIKLKTRQKEALEGLAAMQEALKADTQKLEEKNGELNKLKKKIAAYNKSSAIKKLKTLKTRHSDLLTDIHKTLEAGTPEPKEKQEELSSLEKEIVSYEKNEDIQGLESLKKSRSDLSSGIKQLGVAIESWKKHIVKYETEKNYSTKAIRNFTKQWPILREDYCNPDKNGALNKAIDYYKELIFPMFKGKHLEISVDLERIVKVNGLSMMLSHNRHAQYSDVPSKSGIKNRIDDMKRRNQRGEPIPDLDVESHHLEGFKVCAELKNIGKNDLIYFLQLPTLHDPDALNAMKHGWIKTFDVKRIDSPYASGLVLLTARKDSVLEIEFYSNDILKKIGKSQKNTHKKEDELKIEICGDVHIGAPNEPGLVTNYELIEAVKIYQENNGRPDIIIACGDMINGQHREEIIHEFPRRVPSVLEEERKSINLDEKLSEKENMLKLKELEREEKYGGPITSVSKQKQELKKRLYEPYWQKVLEDGGEIIIVSGQHYNKGTHSQEDEAIEIANMIDLKYKDQVHIFSGATFGSGQEVVKGLDIFAIHAPKKAQDEVAGLMRHTIKTNKKPDLAVGADYHHPGIGWADGTIFVAAAGLQTWSQYVDQIGKQGSARGIINLFVSPTEKGYVRYELVFEKTLTALLD